MRHRRSATAASHHKSVHTRPRVHTQTRRDTWRLLRPQLGQIWRSGEARLLQAAAQHFNIDFGQGLIILGDQVALTPEAPKAISNCPVAHTKPTPTTILRASAGGATHRQGLQCQTTRLLELAFLANSWPSILPHEQRRYRQSAGPLSGTVWSCHLSKAFTESTYGADRIKDERRRRPRSHERQEEVRLVCEHNCQNTAEGETIFNDAIQNTLEKPKHSRNTSRP